MPTKAKPAAKRSPARTLKRLRADAPEGDRDDAALKPAPAEARTAKGYVAYSYWPRTLDELRERCGKHGQAAVAEANWGAISAWLMKGPADGALTHPSRASRAAWLCREHERATLGYPDHERRPQVSPLDGLSPDDRREALLVGAATVADWERAGCPWLDADRIKTTFQYVQSCERDPDLEAVITSSGIVYTPKEEQQN